MKSNSQSDEYLTQALDVLRSNHEIDQIDFRNDVARLQQLRKFADRRSNEDRLFQTTYRHEEDYDSQCSHCLSKHLVQRSERAKTRSNEFFKFHCDIIVSGEAVIKTDEKRDELSKECNNARCFEMKTVEININSRCLIIRDLADYADFHKNDVWQYVAAGNAAIFAKKLLLIMQATNLRELSRMIAAQKSKLDLT